MTAEEWADRLRKAVKHGDALEVTIVPGIVRAIGLQGNWRHASTIRIEEGPRSMDAAYLEACRRNGRGR